MIIGNSGSFYRSPYGSVHFSDVPNSFSINSHPIPSYYNSVFQPKSHNRAINQQNNNKISNIPSFKLYDLDTNDQGEIIRLIFSFVDIPYKDRRLKENEWMKIKDQMSFDQLPILRINDQFKIFHIYTIIRHLAREFHLYGTNKYDHAIIDSIIETTRQLQEKIFEQINDTTNSKEIIDQSIIYLNQLEKFYETFHRHGPFYLGSHISLADLIVYDIINYLIKIDSKILEKYSHLKETCRCLEKHPGILNYIKTKNNNNQNQNQTQKHKSPSSQRHITKSPTPNKNSYQHRHRSHEGHKLGHHYSHNHHHHHHHHHRRHSKEPTPISQTKQSSRRSSKSPSILTIDKETTSLSDKKQRSIRSSKSPSILTTDKEITPFPETKSRSINSKKPTSILSIDKESTSLKKTDTTPPPTTNEQKT